MATVLALIEGSVLFAAVCLTIFRWAQPFLTGWFDVTAVIGQALALSLCCVVAFYYNDLYDLRIVHSLDSFVSRLLQSFGVAFILLAGFYSIFPGSRMAEGPILSSVLLTVGVLLPIRALSYGFLRSRPFQERIVILGTSPVALRLIAEIEAQPQFRYVVVGVVDEQANDLPGRYPFFGPVKHLKKI